MAQSQTSETARVQEVYKYAAELMKAGSSEAEIRANLMDKGLDEQAAAVVVTNLVALRSRALAQAATKSMLWGALWCVAGTVATAGTYLLAAPGETYVVAWGAIIFGAVQFVRGWSRSGPQGRGMAIFCMVAAVCLLGFLSLGYLLLSNVWATYKDERFDFTVSHPILWKVEVEEEGEVHKVSFVARRGSGLQGAWLRIWVEPDPDVSSPTTCDALSTVKVIALAQTDVQIGTNAPRCVDSRPGSEIAFLQDRSEGPITARMALCRLGGTLWRLGAVEAEANAVLLETLYNRFVNSFRFGPSFPKPGPCPDTAPVQCPSGYDPYSDSKLGFSVCYPAQWVAICPPEDQSTPQDSVMFAPPVFSDEGYTFSFDESIFVMLESEPAGIQGLTDQELVRLGLEHIVEQQGIVAVFPHVSTMDGRRCLESAWRTKSRNGNQLEEITYLANVLDGERTWSVVISGPSDRASQLDSTYEVFAASFHVLPRR